jgi:cobaltochelatase CobT
MAPPPSSKRKVDPQAPFKRALSLATRTLAGNKSINVTFGSDPPGFDGKTVRLPQPARVTTRKEIAIIRGHADSLALMIAAHDARLHAKLSPDQGAAKDVFDAVEKARVEALGSLKMRGVAKNLSAKLATRYERLPDRDVDRQDAPLEDAMALLVREHLTGLKPPRGGAGIVEA